MDFTLLVIMFMTVNHKGFYETKTFSTKHPEVGLQKPRRWQNLDLVKKSQLQLHGCIPTFAHKSINREWPRGRGGASDFGPNRSNVHQITCLAALRQFLFDADNSRGWRKVSNSLSTSKGTGIMMAARGH